MGTVGGPNTISDTSLVLELDAADKNSYPGSGATWTDLSGDDNNVTLVATPTYSSLNGGGLVFNGSTQYGTATDSTTLRPTAFTLDAWFRPTSFSTFNTVVVKPATAAAWTPPYLSYMIRIETNGTVLDCGTSTAGTFRSFTTNRTFSTNTTYNISFTFDSSTGAAVVYLNGSVINSTTTTAGAITYAALPLLIGASYGTNPVGEFFAGSIYNVRLYNTVLSASNVLQNYNAQKTRFGL